MAGTTWGKFFWSDWESDPNLKLCSLAAQGLWMRILCICATSDVPGHMVLAGKPVTNEDLAAIVGKPLREVNKLMTELADRAVFSRDSDGVVFSRRMKRDAARSQSARERGKQGGNPLLLAIQNNPLRRIPG